MLINDVIDELKRNSSESKTLTDLRRLPDVVDKVKIKCGAGY
jgi:hypothetical protein